MSAQDVIGFCQAEVVKHMNDCSGFVRAVAGRCGILMSGNANQIVDSYILTRSVGWECLVSETDAVTAAMNGKFVVGGRKASGHGHVVIVVGMKNTVHPGRAYGFWGRYHGLKAGAGTELNVGVLHLGHGSLTRAWNRTALSDVRYSAIEPSALLMQNAPKGTTYHL